MAERRTLSRVNKCQGPTFSGRDMTVINAVILDESKRSSTVRCWLISIRNLFSVDMSENSSSVDTFRKRFVVLSLSSSRRPWLHVIARAWQRRFRTSAKSSRVRTELPNDSHSTLHPPLVNHDRLLCYVSQEVVDSDSSIFLDFFDIWRFATRALPATEREIGFNSGLVSLYLRSSLRSSLFGAPTQRRLCTNETWRRVQIDTQVRVHSSLPSSTFSLDLKNTRRCEQ